MPEERVMRRDRGRRAERSEPTDPVSRLLARASAVAAGVALASLGLAVVASQAGTGGGMTLASDGDIPELGRQMGPAVPAVKSPELALAAFDVEVIVQPRLVLPPPQLTDPSPTVSTPQQQPPGSAGSTGEPAQPPVSADHAREEREPHRASERRGDESRDAWREWWDGHSEEWGRAWTAAIEREWQEWESEGRGSRLDGRGGQRHSRD